MRRPRKRPKEPLIDEHQPCVSMALVGRAIREGWAIPANIKASLPGQVIAILESSTDDRTRLRAAEMLATFDRDNLAALVHADKSQRLDDDKPTERQRVEVVFTEGIGKMRED